MNKSFWAKVGFALIFIGVLLEPWLNAASNVIVWMGLCYSFFCFLDIDRELKDLKDKTKNNK